MSEAAVTSIGVPGWFGKLPSLGDFASRRLPDRFVQRWDRWLQRGLTRAHNELGEAWLPPYLVAPIRRFWLAPGVLDTDGWAGLMMPSVDRVGRHFPLTIALPVQTLRVALAARGWFVVLDKVARQVLDVTFTVDDFERALAEVSLDGCAADDDAARQMAQRLLSEFTPDVRCSVWWCDEAGEDSQFLCFPAMPPAAAFASMIGAAP